MLDQQIYAKINKHGVWTEIQLEETWQTWIYYGYTCLAVLLVLAQLGLGLTVSVLTSLSGNNYKNAVIVLGALNSGVGGLAAILQWRGQPARSARYLQALRKVKSDARLELGEFITNPHYKGNKDFTVRDLVGRFQKARDEALSNDPLIYDRTEVSVTQPPPGSHMPGVHLTPSAQQPLDPETEDMSHPQRPVQDRTSGGATADDEPAGSAHDRTRRPGAAVGPD